MFLLITGLSYSAVHSIIPEDKQSAILIIQGQDLDAVRMYDSMNVEEVLESNILKKKIEYFAPTNFQTLFTLICNKSILTPELASCTFKIFNVFIGHQYPLIRKDPNWFMLGVGDRAYLRKLIKPFNMNDDGEIFRSESNEFRILVVKDIYDSPISFTMEYKKL